ncbi:efflux RND transporter permease subunit [Pseudoalteromonas sp. MMG005]|uniref:efflux RND transporter permease subunit n=1 Tax=Pseudoalteromonas sp. MMG005 TaxID=2822682 RepID=UPI001B3A5582|nr:efflux RND transporter permease subunit [Pseudoalteromonas sp. MMG005]MBQ4844601.1 efflux RND transporter permease subunit [Pseudoalteromonas sp. MMG005]
MQFLFSNGRLQALLVALLIVTGFSALNNLPLSEDPRIINRFAIITTYLPGATASRVEAQITEKLELKLKSQAEIKNIIGMSRAGISVISIELKDEVTAVIPVWSRIRDLLADAQSQLPQQASLTVLEDDRGYAYTKIIAITGEQNAASLMRLNRFAKELKNQLTNTPGVEIVHLFGGIEEEIRVTYDSDKATLAGVSLQQIADAVKGADPKVAAGAVINDESHLQIELNGSFDSLARIAAIPLASNDDIAQFVLADVATVTRQLRSPRTEVALIDGQQGVFLGVRMQPEFRVDRWSAVIDEKLSNFELTLPGTVQAHTVFDQKVYTEARLGELIDNIAVGFALILGVLLLTLGLRAALIVGAALPLTVLFTLACMNIYGLPIHQMSVTGLVVALGIMVDNAIVITDSIARYRQKGMTALHAVKKAVNHFWLPLLSSTLTTILAFAPIVLMPGPSGEFVGGIALSVIFALIGSYVVSHTLIAVFAGRFLPQKSQQGVLHNGVNLPSLSGRFKSLLYFAIARPKLTILLSMILPIFGFISASQLTEQFFPPADRDMFHIEVRLSPNSSISATQKRIDEMSEFIHQYEGIEQLNWMIGNNIPLFYYNLLQRDKGAKNYAQAMVKVSDFKRADELIHELQYELDRAFPEAQTLVRKLEQGPPFNAPIELRVFGPNLSTLSSIGQKLRTELIAHQQITHTRATLESGSAKVTLNADETLLSHAGVKLTDIATQLEAQFEGVVIASVLEETETIPVRLRTSQEQSESIDALYGTQFITEQPLLLAAFADASLEPVQSAVHRRNGERVNVIEGFLQAGVLPQKVLNEIQPKLQAAQAQLPAGYRIEVGGESQQRDEAVGRLLGKIGIIVVLLVSVLVLTFNSFTTTAVILVTAVQSALLGLLSVYIAGYPFGFTVIIALLGLMGLAINAAIVILSELKVNNAGQNDDKVVMSVMTCGRHISSTTITTVGGFMPLILAGGGFWPPFAVAIAGGTVLTTLLSFFFVPAVYKLFIKTTEAQNPEVHTLAVSDM